MLELFLDGYEDTFEISPSLVEKSANFVISVKSNRKLTMRPPRRLNWGKFLYLTYTSVPLVIIISDCTQINWYEKYNIIWSQIAAREIGPNKLTTKSRVTVNLLDANDNPPRFENEKYEVEVRENEEPGKVILRVSDSQMYFFERNYCLLDNVSNCQQFSFI